MTSERAWRWATTGLAVAAFFCAALTVPVFSYTRWDNFEYFAPIVSAAHAQWLRGSFPYWNFQQHLGEPLLAQGQPGVFYPLYTLAYALTRLFRWSPDRLVAVIVILHVPLAALGWFQLFRRWKVRPALCLGAALAAVGGSFISLIATVWGQMFPLFSWLPWVVYGASGVLDDSKQRCFHLAFVLALTCLALLGYPQILIYAWMWTGLFAVAYAGLVRKSWSSLGSLALSALVAALFSAPTLLPLAHFSTFTLRSQAFNLGAFVARSVSPECLLSLFTSVLQLPNDFLSHRGALAAYQGAWVLPMVAGSVWFARRQEKSPLLKILGIFLALSVLFFVLALGDHGKLYPLTKGIPVWSSFLWPFKFLLLANASLIAAAAMGLEIWARAALDKKTVLKIYGSLLLFAGGVAGLMRLFPLPASRLVLPDVLVLIGGIGAGLALPRLNHRRGALVFAGCSFLSTVGVLGQSQAAGLRLYAERYGSVGAAELGVDNDYRVLPISNPDPEAPRMQSLALFHSATMNNYFSATGCTTAMIPWWYLRSLPSTITGVLENNAAARLVGSHLLRSLNVRYVVARADDRAALELLHKKGYREIQRMESGVVYEDSVAALRRVYFAIAVAPYSAAALETGLIDNKAPLGTTFVEDSVESKSLAKAEVETVEWGDSRVRVAVHAPQGGFLVLATTYFPDWQARVDGQRVSPKRVNGTVQGVWVPANSRLVEFYYQSTSLELGVCLAVLGALILVLQMRKRGQHTRS